MKNQLIQNNYVVIDAFITPEQASALAVELEEGYKNYPTEFRLDAICPNSPAICDMYPFVELMVEKIPLVASITEEPVFPTYSYARIYKNGATLAKHIDRSACEISVTLNLSNDGVEWPIYFETPDNQAAAVNLKPGQAAVYLGSVAPHWRDTYEGTNCKQAFLHYVRARGENRHCYFDKRK